MSVSRKFTRFMKREWKPLTCLPIPTFRGEWSEEQMDMWIHSRVSARWSRRVSRTPPGLLLVQARRNAKRLVLQLRAGVQALEIALNGNLPAQLQHARNDPPRENKRRLIPGSSQLQNLERDERSSSDGEQQRQDSVENSPRRVHFSEHEEIITESESDADPEPARPAPRRRIVDLDGYSISESGSDNV